MFAIGREFDKFPGVMINSDRTAILAILSRWSRHWAESARLATERNEIDTKIAQTAAGMANAEAGLKVFGFDVSQGGVWDQLRAMFGNDLQSFMEREDTQNQQQWAPPKPKSDPQSFLEQLLSSDDKKKPPMPTIREIALMRLREAGPAGSRAKTIREYIQTTYGVECHEKTVGMTLL